MPHRLFDRWTVLTLLGVGVFMFWGAGHYTVFDDEGFSCRRYTMPMGEMVSALWHGEEPDPPLYYLLQNAWTHLFGVGPLGLRSLSIIMFLTGLVFIRLAGREWYDEQTGRLAMIVSAVHPAHLLFGLAGRWYSTMFCAVAILFYVTGRLARQATAKRSTVIAWSLAAAAVCCTNYFGVVVVGLTWVVMMVRHSRRRGWMAAAVGALLLYAVWLPAFWHQATSFPNVTFSLRRNADAALRILMALSTGNLASVGAWWIWMLIFVGVVFCCLSVHWWAGRIRRPSPLAQIVVLCMVAGVVSRTIIDKYIMAFSGPACILLTAAALANWNKSGGRWKTGTVRAAVISLGLAWLGCYVNLMTEQHWSSLRWLDPYEKALNDLADHPSSPQRSNWVISQPAARYYYGCLMARRNETSGVIPADLWRRFAVPPTCEEPSFDVAATPESMLARMYDSKPPRIATIRGAEFSDSPDWTRLESALVESYKLADERTYLKDPDAAWKDRLDPAFKHPQWRITVRVYELENGK